MKKLLALLLCSSVYAHDLKFVVVIPSYNNERYVRRNLESVISQKTEVPFSIIYVNDCSQDNTLQLVHDIKKEYNLSDSFLKIIDNQTRIGALANIYYTVHDHVKDHHIVVHLDGDDALAHTGVLTRLANAYKDPQVWMTYGQFVFVPEGPIGYDGHRRLIGTTYDMHEEAALQGKTLRELTYVAQHLRTYKAGLFKRINKEHLQLNGEFYEMNADMATMIPMLEMAGPKHSMFISDILCMYTYDNPINDHKVNRNLQLYLEDIIRAIEPYEPINSL